MDIMDIVNKKPKSICLEEMQLEMQSHIVTIYQITDEAAVGKPLVTAGTADCTAQILVFA
jgi:hypothetical protein